MLSYVRNMPGEPLSFSLHQLTARMDLAADRILRDQLEITYPRFLALFATDLLDSPSQRDLAGWLGLSEPSVSRTVRGLEADGLVQMRATPGGGNRRTLDLTPHGRSVVKRGKRLLVGRFDAVVRASQVDHAAFHDQVRAILAHLDPAATQ
jgi:DNA-binding MarR family transcriptional regulator